MLKVACDAFLAQKSIRCCGRHFVPQTCAADTKSRRFQIRHNISNGGSAQSFFERLDIAREETGSRFDVCPDKTAPKSVVTRS